MEEIQLDLKQWIASQIQTPHFQVQALQGDASFRSYYRIMLQQNTFIAMRAPPGKERTEAFVSIARAWGKQGLAVPAVLGWEPTLGFALLSDFGDTLLLNVLDEQSADKRYSQAMEIIARIQKSDLINITLPLFDENHIRRELGFFLEWFLNKLLAIRLTKDNIQLLHNLTQLLIDNILSQTKVIVHRDYHSRNLMLLPTEGLGIIDFQDAMIGPVTYDLVSILKDCYIQWPREKVENWVKLFYENYLEKQLICEYAEFLRWFDWMGLKRHLRVLGIFARLKLRDNKPQYLGDMPRIMRYILEVTELYPEFLFFHQWLKIEILPHFQEMLLKENSGVFPEKVA